METTEDGKKVGKGKPVAKGCCIASLVVLVVLAAAAGFGWSMVAKEHREAASLPLNAVDFNALDDGTYHGVYAGGMYKWRHNECNVTVTGGKVSDIQLTDSIDAASESTDAELLYGRVIQAQSLQVDAISSATLTSKGYLQCVENALVQAQPAQ